MMKPGSYLVKLVSGQVLERWDELGYYIMQALPAMAAGTVATQKNLLDAFAANKLTCWLAVEVDEEKTTIVAVVVTMRSLDEPSGTYNLIIYSLFGMEKIKPETWEEGLRVLQVYAKSKGCNKIIAFSNSPHVIHRFVQAGGQATATMLELEV